MNYGNYSKRKLKKKTFSSNLGLKCSIISSLLLKKFTAKRKALLFGRPNKKKSSHPLINSFSYGISCKKNNFISLEK